MSSVVFDPVAPVVRLVPLMTAVWFRLALTAVAMILAALIVESRMASPSLVTFVTTPKSGIIGTTQLFGMTIINGSPVVTGTGVTTVKVDPTAST
jgi:hypothetical protein